MYHRTLFWRRAELSECGPEEQLGYCFMTPFILYRISTIRAFQVDYQPKKSGWNFNIFFMSASLECLYSSYVSKSILGLLPEAKYSHMVLFLWAITPVACVQWTLQQSISHRSNTSLATSCKDNIQPQRRHSGGDQSQLDIL